MDGLSRTGAGADDFGARVAEAQATLAKAAARAGLTHDPYQYVLQAQAETIGLFPALIERIQASAEATRQPALSPTEHRIAIGRALMSHAGATVSALHWVAMVGMVALLFLAVGLGFWLHWQITPIPLELTCRDERGGRVCFAWVRPPTEPLEPQQQATPAPPPPAKPATANNRK